MSVVRLTGAGRPDSLQGAPTLAASGIALDRTEQFCPALLKPGTQLGKTL